jgi:hypothetical protein
MTATTANSTANTSTRAKTSNTAKTSQPAAKAPKKLIKTQF